MALLLEGLGQIGAWLDRRSVRGDRADAAVKAVLLAVNETSAYIADRRVKKRLRDRELLLVRLWTDAAVAIRRKDPQFAQQLQMKAQFLTDPQRWTDVDVRRAGIQIEHVAMRARAMLGGA